MPYFIHNIRNKLQNRGVDFLKPFKTAILGGGASGICAAIENARSYSSQNVSYETVVFEHLGKPLKKLLATGNGRCNFSNLSISPSNYHGSEELTNSVLNSEFSNIEAFFNELGIKSAYEDGRIYPRSMQASAVRDALLFEESCYNIKIKCDFAAESLDIKKDGNGFSVNGEHFDSLIIACGSKAAEKQGSDGSLFSLIKSFNHTFTPIFPALTAITSSDKSLKTLAGTRLFGTLSLLEGDDVLRSEQGEIQFTSNCISGIPAFNASFKARRGLKIFVDMCPTESPQDIKTLLSEQRLKYPKKTLECALFGLVPQKAAYAVVNRCFSSPEPALCTLTDSDLIRVSKLLKRFVFTVDGTRDFAEAQTAKGGISPKEIDKNLMSRLTPGLFFCGEILDVTGDCGGYNLHFAFSSGRLSGKNAAQYSIEKGQKR